MGTTRYTSGGILTQLLFGLLCVYDGSNVTKIVRFLILFICWYGFVRLGILISFLARFYLDRKWVDVKAAGLSNNTWYFWSRFFASPFVWYGIFGGIGLLIGWWIIKKIK